MSHPFVDSSAVVLGVVAAVLLGLFVLTVVVYVVASRRRDRRDHERWP